MTTARQRKAIYTRAAEGVLCEGLGGVFTPIAVVNGLMIETPELSLITYGNNYVTKFSAEDRAMLLLLAAAMCDD